MNGRTGLFLSRHPKRLPSEVIVDCKLSCMGALAPENEHRSRKRETHTVTAEPEKPASLLQSSRFF